MTLVEDVMKAMMATREWRAGVAFGVPEDARDSYTRALAVAAIDVMRGAADDGLRARVEAVLRDYDLAQPAARDRLRAALGDPRPFDPTEDGGW